MSLSIAIVGHVDRAHVAADLTAQLAPATLFLDDGSLGEWPNHRRALAWASTTRTRHTLIVQDDTILGPNFLTNVHRAIAEQPTAMIGLYIGQLRPSAERITNAVQRADAASASWLTADRLFWGVATILPTTWIRAILAHADRNPVRQYDRKLGAAWTNVSLRPVLYTWPSLVNHADLDQITTDHDLRDKGRIAHRVGQPTWSDIVVTI